MCRTLLVLPALLFSINACAIQHTTEFLAIEVFPWSYGSSAPPTIRDYEILPDGIKYSLGEWVGGGNSGLPESREFIFNVTDLSFSALAGYKITGYEFSVSGLVSTSSEASATISGGMMGGGYTNTLSYYGGNGDWTPYSFSTSVGAGNPAGGPVSVYGSLYIDAPYYWDYVYDEYGNVIDYVLLASGRAEITMDSLTIKAFIAPIPEPETYLMFLVGIGAVAWRVRKAGKSPERSAHA